MNKSRIMAMFAALVVALGLAVAVQAPAHAAQTTSCIDTNRGIRTCVTLAWIPGYRVTNLSHTTPQNCDNLESSGGRYYAEAGGTFNYNWGSVGCSMSKAISDGACCWSTKYFYVIYKARINNGTDMKLIWDFYLHKDGSVTINKSNQCWVSPDCGGN